MRRNYSRQPRILETGVVLLVAELMNSGFNVIPPVTLFTIIAQILLYVDVLDLPWDKWDVCISGKKVWIEKDYKTLLLSTVEHGDDMHLYYNMISFLMKGRSLEPKYGSPNFALFLGIISLMTSSVYVALSIALSRLLLDSSFLYSCAIGFSGVIFALKVIVSENSPGYSYVMGFRIPTRFAAWAELIAIHVISPNASFVGHLAGIITGILYLKTPLRNVIDTVLTTITGIPINPYKRRSESYRWEDGAYRRYEDYR